MYRSQPNTMALIPLIRNKSMMIQLNPRSSITVNHRTAISVLPHMSMASRSLKVFIKVLCYKLPVRGAIVSNYEVVTVTKAFIINITKSF